MGITGKATILGALLMVAATPAAAASLWTWSATPYLWGAGVSTDVDVNDEPVLASDVSFHELLEKTDLALMGRFEGRKGRQGFFVDALFLGVSDESSSGGTETDSDLDTWLAEAGGFWRPSGEKHGLDLLYGVRLLDFSLDVHVTLPSALETTVKSDKSYVDGFLGARWSAPFANRWDVSLRGDVGSGGSDLSWNAVATVGVFFDERGAYTLRFGYHHMVFQLEDDDRVTVETDLVYSGPFAGFTFAWGEGV